MASSTDTAKRPSRRRAVLFRLAAVLLALSPFVLAELVFVMLDWGRPTRHDDPFVGFSAVHPLFVPSEDGRRYEIAESRWRCFRPHSFPAAKDANEYRIFCLGGSTVQGRPYAVETSFTTWLELNLKLAEPGRTWRVVNCGGVSYASYRLVPILEEVLAYRPDMIVLYVGHNEFLEDREYAHIRDRSRWVAAPWEWVARTRTYNLLREGYRRAMGTSDAEGRPVLKADVDAILDYKGGLAKYRRDDRWRRGVIEHFRFNIERLVRMARQAGVNVLLVNPVSNLRDCPPFKSQNRDGLTGEQFERWKAICRVAAGQSGPRAVKLLREALAIDDQYALVHFRLGKALDGMGEIEQARAAYVRAKELDICPLRMLEPMHEAIGEVARQTGTPLVDARKLIEQCSPDGIPGNVYLCDHVHPKIAAHWLIADALIDELARQQIVRPRPGWRDEQAAMNQQHLASLGPEYLTAGVRRLEALRGWATGRAELQPPADETNRR